MKEDTDKIYEKLSYQVQVGKALLNGWAESEKIKDLEKREKIHQKLLKAFYEFDNENKVLFEMIDKELNKPNKVIDLQLHKVHRYLKADLFN